MNGSALSAAQCAFRLAGGFHHRLMPWPCDSRASSRAHFEFCIRSRLGPFNLSRSVRGRILPGRACNFSVRQADTVAPQSLLSIFKRRMTVSLSPLMAEKIVLSVDPVAVPDDGDKSFVGSPIETPVLCQFSDDSEEVYPEGGRGWLVVAGCFLQATVTLGTEYRGLFRSCDLY